MIGRIRLQTEYMGTHWMNITVHGMYLDITVDHAGFFFRELRSSRGCRQCSE